MKWDIIGNTLYIYDYDTIIDTQNPVADITEKDTTCFEYDLTKKPAYGRYEYQTDANDAASNEVAPLYNDIVDYDGEADNPTLEGENDKQFAFATVGFLHDYIGDDYVDKVTDDARITAYVLWGIVSLLTTYILLTAGVTAALAAPLVAAVAFAYVSINNKTQDLKGDYGDGSQYRGIIRVKGGGVRSIPSIIRYDETTPINAAKVVAVPVGGIVINPVYNTDSVPYEQQNFGIGVYKTLQYAYNYPLYFDSWYEGTLYDKHETSDNPLVVNISHKQARFDIPLCCETLKQVGVEFGSVNIVGRVINVQGGYNVLVTEATVNYEKRIITIKGKLLLT
jgi:hypothetical protein